MKKKIYKANKFTGKNKTVLVNEAFSPKDLHIYHPQRQPQGNWFLKSFKGAVGIVKIKLMFILNANKTRLFFKATRNEFFFRAI